MDFAAERYVRLYVRDTATWSLMCWQARCVFPLLMRKVDGAGVLDLPPGRDAVEVVSKVLDMPEDVVRPALDDLDGAGVVEVGNALVIVNFVEAQRCTSTDKARKAAQRERDRALSKRKNNGVTSGHAVSRDVTPCPTEPIRTDPNRSEPKDIPASSDAASAEQPKVNGKKRKDRLSEEFYAEVFQALRDAVRRVTGKPGGPQDRESNREMVRKCTEREQATIDHWRTVIAAQEESVRGSRSTWRYLCLSTITRRSNWARLLEAPSAPSTLGSVDPSTQDHNAERDF